MKTTDKVYVGDSTTSTTSSCTYPCPLNHSKAEQGWECPRCGRVNAPWVRQCDCSNNWTINCGDKSGYSNPWWKDYITGCDADNVLNNPNKYTVGGSDYWNPNTKTYENVPTNVTNKIDSNSIDTKWTGINNYSTYHCTTPTYSNNVCKNH